MKFSYRLSKICGNIYENGNLIFTPDGNILLSSIGNRITLINLIQHNIITLPFENKKDIYKLCLSNNGKFLISIDIDGHALFINLPRRVILTRFHFKRKVYDIKFSPNDKYFVITYGRGGQIWKTPSIQREFSPLVLTRNLGGLHDDAICLNWSSDSNSVIIGSKDLTTHVYHNVHSKFMASFILSGHRSKVVGVFYSQDNEQIYTIAKDGAVFTWQFEYTEPLTITDNNDNIKNNHKKDYKVQELSIQNDSDNDINSDSESDSNSENESESDENDDGDDIHNLNQNKNKNSKNKNSKNKKNKNKNQLQIKGKNSKRNGIWKLLEREFLWDSHTEICSTAFNSKSNLLVVGFSSGIFGLYSMPKCQNIHKLSVSHNYINSVDINSSGEWLAIGSKSLGQLLVWEWQSESYVIKQQGHMYGLNALDFSSDGMYVATGGEDSKVKVWNVTSGFCFVTFTKHIGPITGVKFIGKGTGKAVISSSMDGTVRAYDLIRYQNFRTLTTPTPVQLTSLAVDSSGEMVCAGAMDPFQIYVWSLQTGKLLDVLSGHEGPIACLTFAQNNGRLASGSWDGTLKLWDIYKNECIETFEHGCDVMAISFRPDGKEVCCATTNGIITFWDVDSGTQISTIEGRKHISVGRKSTDLISSKNKLKSKYFTCLAYTADGSCVLAGSQSKSVCIYAVSTGTLIKKYELSHNRSLEGTNYELRSDLLVDGVPVNSSSKYSDDEEEHSIRHREETNSTNDSSFKVDGSSRDSELLPGAGKGSKFDGSRNTAPEILSTALGFSPTGREWAAATTQGLQIFSLDEAIHFAPTDLDMTITPQAIRKAIRNHEYTLALNMSLHLAENNIIKEAVDAVEISSISLVVKSIDISVLKRLLRFLADEIANSRHIEYYLRWCWHLISAYGQHIQGSESIEFQESLRSLIRAITLYETNLMRMSDENQFILEFIKTQDKQFESIVLNKNITTNNINSIGNNINPDKIDKVSSLKGYRLKNIPENNNNNNNNKRKLDNNNDNNDNETKSIIINEPQEIENDNNEEIEEEQQDKQEEQEDINQEEYEKYEEEKTLSLKKSKKIGLKKLDQKVSKKPIKKLRIKK